MIWRSNIHVLLLFVLVDVRVYCNHLVPSVRGICTTDPPSDLLKAEYRRLNTFTEMESGGYESRKMEVAIEIDTWFHIVSSQANAALVTDEMIASQVGLAHHPTIFASWTSFPQESCGSNADDVSKLSSLQDAYHNATISYQLKGVTRQVNNLWARNGDELAMKSALRKGTYSTLNVYFHTDLQESADGASRSLSNGGDRVLGFCTLPDPSISGSSPGTAYVKDGCNVLAHTMTGGPLAHYNEGGTAIHEIGHWNGLLHTFEGESCSADNEGDFLEDTPQESVPTTGCPSQKDSCPDRPGQDAIHNYMDYSSDDCYESFTPGQVARMRHMWSAMREGK